MECKYQALSAASSIDEIVRVTSEYLESWSHDELERLPDSCRPAWVKSHHDIEFWADKLVGESENVFLYLADERKLDVMTSHFLIASVRLRQLGFAPPYAAQPRSSALSVLST